MNVKIDILDPNSIQAAIDFLENAPDKLQTLCEKCAEAAAGDAQANFADAVYDGTNDVTVSVKKNAEGAETVASGESVAFIEFGTGVYYDKLGGGYPAKKPPEISPIGTYGDGNGSKEKWNYPSSHGTGTNGVLTKDGKRVVTRGNPSNDCLYNAMQSTKMGLDQIIEGVFK